MFQMYFSNLIFMFPIYIVSNVCLQSTYYLRFNIIGSYKLHKPEISEKF